MASNAEMILSSSLFRILFRNTVDHLKDFALHSQNQAVYANLPLEPFSRQIRLVTLYPGQFDSDIECSLEVGLWSEHYDALSYCWGSRHPLRKIYVNKQPFRVTEALHMALKYLRQREVYIRLWIDAISINQWDLFERSWQVPRMARIYSYAQEVIVWLGGPTHSLIQSLDLIDQLTLAESKDRFQFIWNKNQHLASHLEDLVRLPWWSRIWVVQEVMSAKSAKICVGHDVREWSGFAHVILRIGALVDEQRQSPEFKAVYQFVGLVQKIRDVEVPTVQQSLLELAQTFRHRFATDPRDKIYGLMGMSAEAFKNGFFADYSISIAQCYVSFAKNTIIQDQDLYVFSLGEYHGDRKLNLPSWCTDWTIDAVQPLPLWQKIASKGSAETPTFSASGNTKVDMVPCPDPRVLSLKGFVIDEIVTLGDPSDNTSIWGTIASWTTLAPAEETDAFVRVIFAGHLTIENHIQSQTIISALKTGSLALPFSSKILDVASHRRFIITQKGHLGLGPNASKYGDLVCVLFGAAVPFVIRVVSGYSFLIGQAYVDTAMHYDGNLEDDVKARKIILQDFIFK